MSINNILKLIACCSFIMCSSSFASHTNTEEKEKMEFTEPTAAQKFEANQSYRATIDTSKGKIICELNTEKASLSATNFIQLAEGHFYDGLTFHRFEPGFVIQGGDPTGSGSGGPGYTIPAEIGLKHTKGALAWARTSDQINPQRRSSGSQFYITLTATPFLDGQYTVFGYTIEGFDVVESLRKGDVINSITITTVDKA